MTSRRLTVVASITAVIAAVPVLVYLWVAMHRISYPYELDWMEGGSVEQVRQLLTGHSLYAAPSLHFIGWTYPPFYWLLSAAVAKVIGLGYLPLRLVSFASSLVAIGALARITLDQTGDRIAALVAAGLFAATYHLAGDFFDIGRLDSLFVAITLVTLALVSRVDGTRGGLAVGLLAFLAFFTKQIALVAVAPALVWLLVTRRRAGVSAIALLLVLLVGSTLVLDARTHSWYRYYIVSELGGQPWAPAVWVSFWTKDLLSNLWPMALLAGAALTGAVALFRRRGQRVEIAALARSPWGYLAACVVGLLAAAWFARLHTGGYLNVLMPAYAACALVGGVACARVRRLGLAGGVVVALALSIQLLVLSYPVGHQIPGRAQHRAGAELLRSIAALPGPVLVLRHPWYGTQLDKGSFAQSDGMFEVLRSSAPRGAQELRRSLRGALDRDHIQAVVLDSNYDPPPWLARQLAAGFQLQPEPITERELRPPTDLRSAPRLLYTRKP